MTPSTLFPKALFGIYDNKQSTLLSRLSTGTGVYIVLQAGRENIFYGVNMVSFLPGHWNKSGHIYVALPMKDKLVIWVENLLFNLQLEMATIKSYG